MRASVKAREGKVNSIGERLGTFDWTNISTHLDGHGWATLTG